MKVIEEVKRGGEMTNLIAHALREFKAASKEML